VHAEHDVRDNGIALLTPAGEVVESSSLYDVLAADTRAYRIAAVQPYEKRGKWMVDLFHANSLEWMDDAALEARDPIYSRRNVVVTLRHQDAVVIIDWEAKRVVWSWGQDELDGPHDATVLDDGHLLVFDNGLARGWSRVLELDPLARAIVWEYRAARAEDFHSPSRGSSQRLPNGNTLIAESDRGRIFEITRAGDLVWRFLNPLTDDEGRAATIVRARRYEPAFVRAMQDARGAVAPR